MPGLAVAEKRCISVMALPLAFAKNNAKEIDHAANLQKLCYSPTYLNKQLH